MKTNIIYSVEKNDLKEAINETLHELTKAAILGRFSGRLITVNAVAEIHGVHRDTVTRHAHAGDIKPVAGVGISKMLFDLSEVLEMNFTNLRKRQ